MQAKINRMMDSSESMEQIRKQLNACMEEADQVSRDLMKFSFSEELIQSIHNCEARLGQCSLFCRQFSLALENICHMYATNENNIIDYCENTRKRVVRDEAKVQNLTELSAMFEKVFS